MSHKVDNPYKLLFSLGVVSGILGVLLWPLFNYQWIGFYPKQAHFQIMFFGFFWSFVAGFLMTAIPRMTGSPFATTTDLSIATLLVCVQNILNYTEYYSYSAIVVLFQLSFLLYFIIPRFLEKRKIPFDGFLFFPAAFGMSFLGIFLYFFYKDPRFLVVLSGEAFLTNLIVGLGSRLIPALSRLPNAFMHPGMTIALRWKSVLVKVSLLNASFILELLGVPGVAYPLRIAVVGYILIDSFGLFKKGSVFSDMAIGLKISMVFLLIPCFLKWLFLSYNPVAHFHLLYIGGFSLLTILIATRVTLAHSQTNLEYELKSPLIRFLIFMVILSAVLRWVAGGDFSGQWIYLSLGFFIMGCGAWLLKHLSLVSS